MNRRSILALLGLAPIAGAAAAMPRAADPVKLASTGGREVSLTPNEMDARPFVFEDEKLTMKECRVNGITTAGIIRSQSGDFVVDLDAKRIFIRD